MYDCGISDVSQNATNVQSCRSRNRSPPNYPTERVAITNGEQPATRTPRAEVRDNRTRQQGRRMMAERAAARWWKRVGGREKEESRRDEVVRAETTLSPLQ